MLNPPYILTNRIQDAIQDYLQNRYPQQMVMVVALQRVRIQELEQFLQELTAISSYPNSTMHQNYLITPVHDTKDIRSVISFMEQSTSRVPMFLYDESQQLLFTNIKRS